jgi:hypothetical protein
MRRQQQLHQAAPAMQINRPDTTEDRIDVRLATTPTPCREAAGRW